ncbi:hypothetical protein MJT46_019152 [Ovis ammon polii x Ovis aries]|nr:hypothetical protein MJT46_019152 [Ovis ammon polii x Ovis aries]
MLQAASSPCLRARGPTLQATRAPLPGCMVSALSYARVARRKPPLIECSRPPDTGRLKQHLLRAPLDGARRVPVRVWSQPFSRERAWREPSPRIDTHEPQGQHPAPAVDMDCQNATFASYSSDKCIHVCRLGCNHPSNRSRDTPLRDDSCYLWR